MKTGSSMRKTNFFILFFFCPSLFLYAQTPSSCFEIESILVDACNLPEGYNEMVIFRVGSSPLNIADLQIDWPNTALAVKGIRQDAGTAGKVASLNATILSCGYLIEPLDSVLPAGSKVFLFGSYNYDISAANFADLSDTVYAIFSEEGSTSGRFANTTSFGTRKLKMWFTSPASCLDSVLYDCQELVDTGGVNCPTCHISGYSWMAFNGSSVAYDWAGNPTYFNVGCAPPVIPLSVDAGADTSICAGSSVPVQLFGAVSQQDSLIWSGGTGSFSDANADTTFYTPGAGDLTDFWLYLKAYDACGDSLVDSLQVTVHPLPTADLGSDTTLCPGESLVLSGGPVGPYSWSTGATTSSISVSTAGTYWLTIEATCDTIRDTITVSTGLMPSADLGADTTLCTGDSLILSGGAVGPYSWSTGATTSSIMVSTAGTYWISIEAACDTIADTVMVSFASSPSVDLGADTTLCPGESLLLSGGPIGPYSWSTGASTSSISVSTAGVYWVMIEAACDTISDTVSVSTELAPIASLGADTTLCVGDSLWLFAGGPGGTYLWSTGSAADSIKVTSSGSVWLEVSNFCGTASDTIGAIFLPSPIVDLGPADTTLCNGDSITLAAGYSGVGTVSWSTGASGVDSIRTDGAGSDSLIHVFIDNGACPIAADSIRLHQLGSPVVGLSDIAVCIGDSVILDASGGGGVSYLWSTADVDSSITVGPVVTTLYYVDVTNFCGTVRDSALVTVIDSISFDLGADTTLCNGSSLGIGTSVAGVYSWSTGASSDSILVNAAGEYFLTVTASCDTVTDSITVFTSVTPNVGLGNDTTLCEGLSVTLDAGSAWGYAWNTGANTQTINVSTAGIYIVTASDSICGSDADTINVDFLPAPAAFSLTDTLLCGSSTYTIDGPIGSSGSYLWSTGDTTTSIDVTTSGEYILTISNSCGTETDTALITFFAGFDSIIVLDTICPGADSLLVEELAPADSYLWITVNGTINPDTANPSWLHPDPGFSGTIELICIYTNQCGTYADSATVEVLPQVEASFSYTPSTEIYEGTDVMFTNSSTGAVSYQWYFGNNDSSNAVNPVYMYEEEGTYQVMLVAYSPEGCADTALMPLTVLPAKRIIPNVFSPNGDGINDELLIHLPPLENFHVMIYDRWGGMMFESNNIEVSWNGKAGNSGVEAQQGVYYMILRALTKKGEEIEETLDVMLVR